VGRSEANMQLADLGKDRPPSHCTPNRSVRQRSDERYWACRLFQGSIGSSVVAGRSSSACCAVHAAYWADDAGPTPLST
jgi:hypothetical protein